jgi:hypothetical protein
MLTMCTGTALAVPRGPSRPFPFRIENNEVTLDTIARSLLQIFVRMITQAVHLFKCSHIKHINHRNK